MYCKNCGSFLEQESEICPKCGKETGYVKKEYMYCVNCGSQIPKDSNLCPYCGKVYNASTNQQFNTSYNPQYNQPQQAQSESNYLAIAGFVCSFFVAVVGLVLSIIGLSKSKEMNGTGKKMAIAGIVISAVVIALSIISYIIMFAVIGSIPPDSLPLPIYYNLIKTL